MAAARAGSDAVGGGASAWVGTGAGAGASPGPWTAASGAAGVAAAGVGAAGVGAASGDCTASGANGRSTGAPGSAAPWGWAGSAGWAGAPPWSAGTGAVGAEPGAAGSVPADPGRRAGGRPGRSGRDRAADHLTEAQLRGLAQRAGLLALLARHGDRQVGAVQHHLGTADAEPVDPLLDDLLGLHELLAGRFGTGLGAGHQRDPGPALQVDAQLGRGPAVTGEEHQCVERGDDDGERAQITPGTDPPRGGCHG